MSPIQRLMNVLRRRRMDDELRQEIETHLALIEEQERAHGSTVEEAHRKARMRFGNASSYREQALDAVTARWLDQAGRELTFAARRLLRSPVFSLTAVLTLGLAIGGNAAIFTVVQRVLLNPLPYPDSERLIFLDYGLPKRNIPSGLNSMTRQLYYELADHARTLDKIAVYSQGAGTLTGGGPPERIRIISATPSLASTLRVTPALGRWFTEEEGVAGAPQTIVLSNGLWERRYGRDPGIIGRSIDVDGVPSTVVGVMPASFTFPDPRFELWKVGQSTRASASFVFELLGVARLREGASIATARAEMTQLIDDLARVQPNQKFLVSVALPLQEAIVGPVAKTLWFLLAAVGLVLFVACANIANLFLVRSEARQREMAVRRALGAGRAAIMHCFLAETLLLSMAGGMVGLSLSWGAVRLVRAFGPANLPRLDEIRLDWPVVGFTVGLVLVTAVALASIPMLRTTTLPTSLSEQGRSLTAGRNRHRARQLLMAAQTALALVLLVFSGLMVRSFQNLRQVDPGFDPTSTLSFGIALPNHEYPTRREVVATHRRMLDAMVTLPGVKSVSASTCLPLDGGCFGNSMFVEGEDDSPLEIRHPWVTFRGVAAGYVDTMGMRLLRGRLLDASEVDRGEPNILVNQAMVSSYFPNQDPIGQRVRSSTPPNSRLMTPPWLTIVGVVSNTPVAALGERTPVPQLFMPMSIASGPDIPIEALIGPSVSTMSYVVRSITPPSELVPAIRAAVGRVDPNVALSRIRTLQDILDSAAAQTAFTMVLIAIAAAVALILGVVGIYGVISY
ncbi:MAG TPA: ABC transporter permease, partial [Vicinamibacterales bacterium]|nr:ABC transporter permease [Vicinamibacterales bacterium]